MKMNRTFFMSKSSSNNDDRDVGRIVEQALAVIAMCDGANDLLLDKQRLSQCLSPPPSSSSSSPSSSSAASVMNGRIATTTSSTPEAHNNGLNGTEQEEDKEEIVEYFTHLNDETES